MNSTKFRLSREAENGLFEAWEYVSENFGIGVADEVIDAIEKALNLLAENPEAGHFREDLVNKPYRVWPVGPSIIVYRGDKKPIWIAYIGRGERDWNTILREL